MTAIGIKRSFLVTSYPLQGHSMSPLLLLRTIRYSFLEVILLLKLDSMIHGFCRLITLPGKELKEKKLRHPETKNH
jgi:hypothetical protein